ncbi:hypothetical protein GCM10009549_35360 [Streptomyces thermoalcalitolerans]|uniref:Uncharacterized protein n=1 Tax=Streptomyces thermoalcalitolerans TaxID=65605 RepID=A0ABP3ZBF4_9ACTN
MGAVAAAATVHIGSCARLFSAHDALFAALRERGLRPQAPVREACRAGPAETPQQELTPRLLVPVQEGTAWPR